MQKGNKMAETITGTRLRELVIDGKVIENGTPDHCGSLKYDFTLSDEILKSDFSTPVSMANLSIEERRAALIQPGEVVYVLTKERVNLPADMYMSLSANRGMSEFGVLTLGGFAVDPGYSGRLMFGLYNYSSTPFTLIPGSKLIGGVFYSLNENERIDPNTIEKPKSIDEFPARLINIISKYSPTGMNSLEEAIKAISKQVEALKSDFNKSKDDLFSLRQLVQEAQAQVTHTNKSVKELSDNVLKLTESVTNLKTEVSELKDGLKDEVQLRKGVKDELDKQIELVSKKVDKKLIFIKGAVWTLSALVAVLITLLTCWANGWLNFGY